MEDNLSQTVALLQRTPAVLQTLLRDLPESWTLRNEGQDTWSPFDVLSHLIHAERTDWIPRVTMILHSGENKTFEPFDRQGNQDAARRDSLVQLLDRFAELRADSLGQLHALNLQPHDLQRRGRHPALGLVTMSQLLATWAAHDLTHLHQISRVMAYQYRDAVGPWSQYLGVLKCTGHSGY